MCRRSLRIAVQPASPISNPQSAVRKIRNAISGHRAKVAAAAVRRRRRPADGHTDAAQRPRQRASGAGVRVCRAARRRQDDDGAHSGARAELRLRPDGRSVRHVRRVCGNRRRTRHRRPRDRRGDAHAGGKRPRGHHLRPVDRARQEPLQGVHHRRSPPVVELVVQRAAEIDRGTAAARRVHDGDDRAGEDSRNRPLALAGVRVQDDQQQGDWPAAAADRRRRGDRGRRRSPATDRARWRRQHARRAEQARSGDRLHGKHRDGRRRGDGARAGGARFAAGCRSGSRRRGRGRGVHPDRARRRNGLRPSRRVPRAVARRARSARLVGRFVAHLRSRDCRGRGARPRQGAGRAILA